MDNNNFTIDQMTEKDPLQNPVKPKLSKREKIRRFQKWATIYIIIYILSAACYICEDIAYYYDRPKLASFLEYSLRFLKAALFIAAVVVFIKFFKALKVANLKTYFKIVGSAVFVVLILLGTYSFPFYSRHSVHDGNIANHTILGKTQSYSGPCIYIMQPVFKNYYLDPFCVLFPIEYSNKSNCVALSCDLETYDSIIVDEHVIYSIDYKESKFFPSLGKLNSIQIHIDNRAAD